MKGFPANEGVEEEYILHKTLSFYRYPVSGFRGKVDNKKSRKNKTKPQSLRLLTYGWPNGERWKRETGKRGTGKPGTKSRGWKTRDRKTGEPQSYGKPSL